jgi:Domain of unknown function (DUF4145)
MQEIAEARHISAQEDSQTMICPFCSGSTPAVWNHFLTNQDELGRPQGNYQVLQPCQLPAQPGMNQPINLTLQVLWTRCQNEACREYIVQVTRIVSLGGGQHPLQETWFAVPKHKAPPNIDLSLVSESMKEDYLQAYVILEDAPRMSAVLSRRILSDLLKKYDGANQYGTAARIDKFSENLHHPSRLRENLHYLREIADFGAHTQVDKTRAKTEAEAEIAQGEEVCWEDVIINASKEEAEWTLKVVGDLIDYFIIAPAKDKLLREQFDKKIEAAGRKKLSPPPTTTASK